MEMNKTLPKLSSNGRREYQKPKISVTDLGLSKSILIGSNINDISGEGPDYTQGGGLEL